MLIESDEKNLLENMLKRNRGIGDMTDAELHTEAHAKWLYGRWLIDEAQRYGLPVIVPPMVNTTHAYFKSCTSVEAAIAHETTLLLEWFHAPRERLLQRRYGIRSLIYIVSSTLLSEPCP